jgi:uncharacterized protein (TIGR04562 family)
MTDTAKDARKKWFFNWDMFEVMVGGKSPIDLPSLRIRDYQDATMFLTRYGFDPDKDQRHIQAVMIEALFFIQKYLIPTEWAQGTRPPDDIMFCDDIRNLILFASSQSLEDREKQAWACALLRVMHTIAHIEGVYRLTDVEVAREQIIARFQKYIFRSPDGKLWFGTPAEAVELDKIEWKHQKSRHSIFIKLLHKKANVAENIYDLLGVRIVTKKLSDVLLVVKYLKDYHIVTFPNAVPARARNTLIDLEKTKQMITGFKDALRTAKISEEEFLAQIDSGVVRLNPAELENLNPHSSTSYQSIQLTCRQLIRYQEPISGWSAKLKSILDFGSLDARSEKIVFELLDFSKNWGLGYGPLENTSFFPFEVQILDEETGMSNRLGDAAHDRYKLSQIRTARKRVLSAVLTLPSGGG